MQSSANHVEHGDRKGKLQWNTQTQILHKAEINEQGATMLTIKYKQRLQITIQHSLCLVRSMSVSIERKIKFHRIPVKYIYGKTCVEHKRYRSRTCNFVSGREWVRPKCSSTCPVCLYQLLCDIEFVASAFSRFFPACIVLRRPASSENKYEKRQNKVIWETKTSMFLSDRFNQITFFVAFVLLFACIMYPNLVRFVWNTDVSDQDRWTRRKNEQQQKNDLFSLIPIPFSRTIRLHADECPKRIKVNRCHVFFPGILLLMFCPRSQSMLLNYYNLCICSKFDREKIVDINFVLFS